MRAPEESERGSLSIFVAICATSLLMLSGLVIDGGGRLRAIERADALAQEAARAGGQQIDRATLLQGGGIRLDPGLAEAAADTYLSDNGVTGTPVATATSVTVTVKMPYHTIVLGLIGLGDVTVTGVGTARLVPGTNAPEPLPPSTS